MSCFIVPLMQALATSIYRRHNRNSINDASCGILKHKVPALEKMLWGGSIMLIVDHIINGELSWRFPFFTALSQTDGGEVFLRELLCVGLPMSLVLTAVWAIWALLSARTAKA